MTDAATAGTASQEQPADDIRSALAAAFDEAEKATTPAQNPEAETAAKPAADRDPSTGQFVKKDQNAESSDEAAAAVDDAAASQKPGEGEQAASETGDKPEGESEAKPDKFADLLKPWKAADKEMFKNLDPAAQEFLGRRYTEMQGDYTQKLQANARLRTEYEPVDKLFEPYRDVMKSKGFSPASLIESWANVEKKLVSGEQGQREVLIGLMQGYNIAPAKIAEWLGLRAAAPAQQTTQTSGDKPPATNGAAPPVQLPPELVNRIGQIEQAVTGLTTAQRQGIEAARQAGAERAQQEINTFKSEKAKDGTLLRPHFDEVEGDMLAIANAKIANRQPVPALSELYETAVWANPVTRQKLLTAQEQAAEARRVTQDKAKAAAARKAAASVTGAPGSGQATAQLRAERSLREELEAAAEDQAA